MTRRILSLAMLVLVVAATALLLLGVGDADAQINTITVNLDDLTKNQEAAPTETENDILEFEGCLTFERRTFWPPGTSVVIEMSVEMSGVDEVWQYSIDPPTHTFTASETQAFSATLTVPAGLPASQSIGSPGFPIEFTASTDDVFISDVTSDVALVTIAQYYRFTRFFSTEPIKITQGEIIEFNFTIINTGNGRDTFIFEVTNQAEMLFAGLTVATVNPRLLNVGEDANIKMSIAADDEATEGQFKLNVTIKSEGSSQDPNYETPVTSGIEWNIIIEPSIQQQIWNYKFQIIIGVAAVIGIAVLVVILRRLRADGEEEEPEEETPPPKKKRKKRPPAKRDDDADED